MPGRTAFGKKPAWRWVLNARTEVVDLAVPLRGMPCGREPVSARAARNQKGTESQGSSRRGRLKPSPGIAVLVPARRVCWWDGMSKLGSEFGMRMVQETVHFLGQSHPFGI